MEMELPIEIIQHIHSFLDGKEAAGTCLLSKSWYSAWSTRPILVFHNTGGNYWEDQNSEEIQNYVRRSMNRYKESNQRLEKLVLQIGDCYNCAEPKILKPKNLKRKYKLCCEKDYTSFIDQLIADASKLGITQLDVMGSPCFPLQVFGITSLTDLSISCEDDDLDGRVRVLCSRLVSLKLDAINIKDSMIKDILIGCPLIENLELSNLEIYSSDTIDNPYNDVVLCPRLTSLRLEDVYVSDTVTLIRDILSGSPLIENLVLRKHNFLSDIVVSKMHKLVALHIEECYYRDTANRRIKAKVSFGSVNVSEFGQLRSVILKNVIVNDEFFIKFSSRFPRVKDLTLANCTGFSKIHISSRSLKYFELHHKKKLQKAEFDVENISRFVFKLENIECIPAFSFHTASMDWESKVELWCSSEVLESSWFVKLRDFLKELRKSRISLKVPSHSDSVYVDDFPISPTPVVEDLLISKDGVSHAFLCAMFRCCRPTFITLGDSKLDSVTYFWGKLMYELFMINQKVVYDVKCFSKVHSFLIYDLEEIDVVLCDRTVPLRTFLDCRRVFPVDKEQLARFRFKWGAFRCT